MILASISSMMMIAHIIKIMISLIARTFQVVLILLTFSEINRREQTCIPILLCIVIFGKDVN